VDNKDISLDSTILLTLDLLRSSSYMALNQSIALLIDCDNVSHRAIGGVLEELAKYGKVNVRHAHGDWNNPAMKGWIEKVHPNAIRPIQQFALTKGKNATDAYYCEREHRFLRYVNTPSLPLVGFSFLP
jgi:hypothetical protein